MRKLFSLIAAVLFAGSMMAESYTITFKDNGTSSDGTASLTSAIISDYIAEGAEFVSAVAVSGKVYNGMTGYGLKFGNSSNPGAITLTLVDAVKPTSIVMNASPWSATEGSGLLQDSVYATKETGAKGTFADFEYAYDGDTEVTEIVVGTSAKRGYVKSITINYGAGDVVPLTNAEILQMYINDLTLIKNFIEPYKDQVEGAADLVNQAEQWIANGNLVLATGNDLLIGQAVASVQSEYQSFMDNVMAKARTLINSNLDALLAYVPAEYQAECLVIVNQYKDAVMAYEWDINKSVEANLLALQALAESMMNQAQADIDDVINPKAAITCAAVYELAKDDVVDLLNEVVVTFANGKNVWVKDATASLLIYLPAAGSFQAGDVLSGIAGVVDIYNGVTEIKPSAEQAAAITVASGEAPAAEEVAEVNLADVNKFIVMKGVEAVGEFAEGTASNLTINGVVVRNNFKNGYTFEAGKTYNIYGVVTIYQNNPQVYFISAEVAGDTPVEPEVEYFLVGNMNDWAVNYDYQLLPNPKNEGEYLINITFEDMAEFKIVGFDGETTTWYPDGMGNNYNISEQGGDYTVYFRPEGGVEGWYYGFFSVVERVEPVVQQYEVAEAIAAGLQENEEVLVRGIITKMEFKGKNFVKYGSVNIYVADATGAEGEFEFYNCYSLNADTFMTSIPNYDPEGADWVQLREVADANGNAIHVGDTVIAFGKYKLFNTTHELNTGCYLVDIKPASAAPAETITIEINSGLQWTDMVANAGWWQIIGEGETYSFSLSNVSTTEVAGVYTIDNLDNDYSYVENNVTEEEIHFVDGSVTVAVAEDGTVTINGTLVGEDGNNYIFNLTYKDPVAETTVNVQIAEWEIEDTYLASYGLFAVAGTAADGTYVQLALWSEEDIAGDYTEDDLDFQNIGSGIIDANEAQQSIFSATIHIEEAGEAYIVTADLLCYNNTLYHVATVATDIETINALRKAVKSIKNGQVVIEKAGKTYNMNGAVIR